jgi:hypothetical protein
MTKTERKGSRPGGEPEFDLRGVERRCYDVRVLGWIADIFRLAWGLIYWNTRKSWFRYRRGRSPCPCQSLSDSGRAFETTCEAAMSWSRQKRFRRVCPLLVETPDGLRCSVNAEDVRPFWKITSIYYGGALLAVYVVAVLSVFGFLRTIGYPVSILHVGLPPLWHRVGQARGWFFVEQSNRAFAAGKMPEGLLYLASAYDYDPEQNYDAGLALAKISQAGQPARSDEMFQRLLKDHPTRRSVTAENWFRALLPRAQADKIAPLALEQILADPKRAHVWVRALFFATERTGDDRPLRELLASSVPAAAIWHPLVEVELLRRAGRTVEARAALERPWPAGAPAFTLYYRVDSLIKLGAILPALDVLAQHRGVLDRGDEATLRLDAFADHGATANLNRQIDELLAGRLEPTSIRILCAHLIRHPNVPAFERLWDKVDRLAMPLSNETVGSWFSLLTTAGAVGDMVHLHQITARLKDSSTHPFTALAIVESYFRRELDGRPVTSFLPLLPLPIEVTYALLDRYAPPKPMVTVPTPIQP